MDKGDERKYLSEMTEKESEVVKAKTPDLSRSTRLTQIIKYLQNLPEAVSTMCYFHTQVC